MPQKLEWQDRNLFVIPKNGPPAINAFLKRTIMYERAIARCPTGKSTTTVWGRKLTRDQVVTTYRTYVNDSGLAFSDAQKRTSSLLPWSKYVQSGAISDPTTIVFCSERLPLRILYKFAGKGKVSRLANAVTEGLPYVIEVPWIDHVICLFGSGVWKLDAAEQAHELKDIRLLILDRIDRERRKLEGLRRRFVGEAGRRLDPLREPIPESVRIYVWRRDEGKCVICGSQERIEFDHIIPVSKGGSSTERNIQLLCEKCNRAKKDRI